MLKLCNMSKMDSSREIRSMILASFLCPPLQMENDQNSHDIIAYLIDIAARRNVEKENKIRQDEQELLTLNYIDDVTHCKTEEELFNCMTRFTRDYMLTYVPIVHDMKFQRFDAIIPPIKKQLCSWIAAQHILNGENCDGKDFEHMTPVNLYFLASTLIKTTNCSIRENNTEICNGDSRNVESY